MSTNSVSLLQMQATINDMAGSILREKASQTIQLLTGRCGVIECDVEDSRIVECTLMIRVVGEDDLE